MSCKYIYKNHVFNSEAALDDFLIEKQQYESKYGDIVFSRKGNFLRTKQIIEEKISPRAKALEYKMKVRNARLRGSIIDGEEILDFERPYVGVNRFLQGLTNSDGEQIVLEFIVQNYWDKRKESWTNPLRSGENIKDRFTEDEIDLFFEGDPTKTYTSKQEEFQDKLKNARLLTEDECKQLKNIVSKKWEFQAAAGTAIHYVLEQYFKKDDDGNLLGDSARNVIIEHITKNLDQDLSDSLGDTKYKQFKDSLLPNIDQILNYADALKAQLRRTHGKNCEFYPELNITAQLSKRKTGEPDQIFGIIDLAVIDDNGQIHYYDYKTSPKEFGEFSSAKKQGFRYQLAMYGKILKKYGLDYRKSDIRILPIQFDNLRLENPEEAHENPNRAKFKYDGIKYNSNIFIDNETKDTIFKIDSSGRQKIIDNLDDYLPEELVIDVATEDVIQRTNEQMGIWFPDYKKFKAKNLEEIKELLTDAGADQPIERDGKQVYSYRPKNGYGKEIVANDPQELAEKVLKQQQKIERNKEYMADIVVKALKYGQEKGTTDIAEYLKSIDPKRVSDDTELASWFQDYLSRYCNGSWEVIDHDALKSFGIVLIRDIRSNQINILKLSSSFLEYNPFAKNKEKKNKKNRNTLLSYAFQPDINESSNPNSLMLEGYQGNIELMETLLVLNNIPQLFSGTYSGAVIGDIQVANSFRGTGLSASNEQLIYSFKKLSALSPLKHENNILKGDVKLATTFEVAVKQFEDAMNPESSFQLNPTTFNPARLALDEAISAGDKEEKIKAITNIVKLMEKAYPEFKSGITRDILLAKPEARLYNQMLQALAFLNGINFKQQIKDHSKWVEEKTFKGILLKGLSGTYTDNPGNLLSDTLNTVTKVVTQAYQNIRNSMSSKVAQIRKATEELKTEAGYRGLTQLQGNATDLYKNMTYVDSNGDLLFTRLDSSTLTTAERKYLKLILELINENRFGGKKSKAELERMRDSGDIRYYRVPLCLATAESRDSVIGLQRGLKERLDRFHPTKALAEIRAAVEGIFEEDNSVFTNAGNLFEVQNGFEKTDGENVKNRLDALQKNGAGYFERNLEMLAFKHTFAYNSAKELNGVFPIMQAAMGFLAASGASVNKNFENDIDYLIGYIRTSVKNQPLTKDESLQKTNAMLGKIKSVASFMALAFSPVQAAYQSLQGIWQDITLIFKNMGVENTPFTFTNMWEAFKEVYSDLWHFHTTPTKCQLINEWLGVNDMDMNLYSERMRTDQYNKYNFTNLAFKFASRPDYYNRMTIIVAKMKADGIWDALEVKDQQLVYNFKKDKRFSAYSNNNTSDPKYNDQRALYTSIAQQFIIEGVTNPDGSKFQMGQPLPYAWTNKDGESIKSLCDLIYGYYSHEKKSLIHATFLGSLYMQMRTYWSGKKNQYLAPGGVRIQGKWEQAKNEKGELLYYQEKPDGTIDYNEAPTTTPNNSPFYQWKGQFQEGIILTLSNIFRNGISKEGLKEGFNEVWNNEDLDIRNFRRANLRQLGTDILFYVVISCLIAGLLMADWDKELQKESKESKELSDAMKASAVHITRLSFGQSAQDMAWWQTIGGPATDWNPFSIGMLTNTSKRFYNAIFGDQHFTKGIMNSFAVGKQFKPLTEWIDATTHED